MLAVWKDWKLDKLLKIAYQKGTIMCGVSAGAICWFESGITDSWEEDTPQYLKNNFHGEPRGNQVRHIDESKAKTLTAFLFSG